MSLLYPAGERMGDPNLDPVGAGKVYVYDNGTTDQASIWSDPELSVSITQPSVLDTGGLLQTNIYVADNTRFTVKLDNSSDAEQWSRDDTWGAHEGTATTYNEGSTGAVDRTQESKNQDVKSLFDFMTTAEIADVKAKTALVDVSAAVLAALTSVTDLSHGALYAPPGDYLIDTQAVVSTSALEFLLYGSGAEVTRFIVPSTNTGGFLSLTFSDFTSQCSFRDFSVIADGAGMGTALKVTQAEGGNRHNRSIYINRVEIKGSAAATDYFTVGIDFTGAWRPMLDAVIVGGPYGSGISDDLTDSSLLFAATTAIDLDSCYAPHLHNCYAWSAATLISMQSTSTPTAPEAMFMQGCILNGCKTALKWVRHQREPALWITDCHWNYRDEGLDIDGANLVTISKCYPYNEDSGTEYSGTPYDMHFTFCHNVVINSNIFHFTGATDRIAVFVDNTNGAGGSAAADNYLITNNIFNETAAEHIRIGTSATDIVIMNNQYPGTASVANIVDNSNNAVIFEQSAAGTMTFESQADSASGLPSLKLYRNSGSPADADALANIRFVGRNDNSQDVDYTTLRTLASDVTDTTEDGTFQAFVMIAGTSTKVLELSALKYNAASSKTTGGAGSAGAGNQYIEIDVDGTVYKVLHDGTV